MHLFDIAIPGGVTFTESETLTGGDELTIVETGELRFLLRFAQGVLMDALFSRRFRQDWNRYLLRRKIPRIGDDCCSTR